MASRFRLQIVDADTGQIVVGNLMPGRGRDDERELVGRVLARVQAAGVGVLRSEARVLEAVRTAMIRVFQDEKDRVR